MAATTVNVTVRVNDDAGNPVSDAPITAKLTGVEVDASVGYVLPEEITGTTDATGTAVLQLWPNELGSTATMYNFKIENPDTGKVLKVDATIPNADCELHIVANLPAYEGKPDGQLAVDQAGVYAGQAYTAKVAAEASAATATTQAGVATTQANTATTQAGIATSQAGTATAQATTATTQAGIATTKAGEAAASAAAAATSESNTAAMLSTKLDKNNPSATGTFTTTGPISTEASGTASVLFKTSGTTNYSWANQYPSVGQLSLYDHIAARTVLTVDNGNLAIGQTVNPNGYRFIVSTGAAANTNAAIFTNTEDADLAIKLAGGVTSLAPSTGILAFGTSSTERMRLDASGNLIVGGAYYDAPGAVTLSGDGSVRSILTSGTGGQSLIGAVSGVSNGFAVNVGTDNKHDYRWNSGGTEVMRLDTSGNLGLGTSTPAYKLQVEGTAPVSAVTHTGGAGTYTQATASAGVVGTYTSHPLYLVTAAVERLRVTPSGNLLLGTSIDNGVDRLQVAGSAYVSGAIGASETTLAKNGSDTIGAGAYMQLRNLAATRSWATQLSADHHLDWWHLYGGWSKKMTLTSSGSLFLGTPIEAAGDGREIQIAADPVGGVSTFGTKTGTIGGAITYISSNTVNTGFFTDAYRVNGSALKYEQSLYGQKGHKWYTAAYGLAGNPISFTQAMTLTEGGDLYVDGGTGKGRFSFENAAAYNAILSTTSGFAAYNPLKVTASELRFETGASPSEQARITPTGNLLVGTTVDAGSGKLQVSGHAAIRDAGNTFAASVGGSGGSGQIVALGTTSFGASISGYTAGFGTAADLVLQPNGKTVGIGVSPSAWVSNAKALQVGVFLSAWTGSNGSANLGFGAYEGGVNTYNYVTTGDAPTMYQQLSGTHSWHIAAAGTAGAPISFNQAMTLTSSGALLVGTTVDSGSHIMQVTGGLRVNSSATNNSQFVCTSANGAYHTYSMGATGANLGYIGSAYQLLSGGNVNNFAIRAENNLVFAIGSTGHAILDSSGNLGLGVAPSTWGNFRGLQVGTGGSIFANANSTAAINVGSNIYATDWDLRYLLTGQPAGYFSQYNGSHFWYTAPAGTAGDPISFTQAMTLTSGGNLGLGVTPSAWASTVKALQMYGGSLSSGSPFEVYLTQNVFHDGADKRVNDGYATYFGQVNGEFRWLTAPTGGAGTAISATQAMTLTNSGNLLVGRTVSSGPPNVLELAGSGDDTRIAMWANGGLYGNLQAQTNYFAVSAVGASTILAFNTNGGSRMELDAAGNIKVNNTTSAPASNPTGGGILYVEGGALKFRGSSGTVTTIAPA